MRRNVVYARDIKAGEILTEKNYDTKRPGTGLQPYKIYELIGKALVRNVENDKLVLEQDIK